MKMQVSLQRGNDDHFRGFPQIHLPMKRHCDNLRLKSRIAPFRPWHGLPSLAPMPQSCSWLQPYEEQKTTLCFNQINTQQSQKMMMLLDRNWRQLTVKPSSACLLTLPRSSLVCRVVCVRSKNLVCTSSDLKDDVADNTEVSNIVLYF